MPGSLDVLSKDPSIARRRSRVALSASSQPLLILKQIFAGRVRLFRPKHLQ